VHKKSRHKQNENSSDKELIDISNDDEVFKIEESSMKISENTYNIAIKFSPMLLRINTITSKPEISNLKMEVSVSKTEIETPMKTVYIYNLRLILQCQIVKYNAFHLFILVIR